MLVSDKIVIFGTNSTMSLIFALLVMTNDISDGRKCPSVQFRDDRAFGSDISLSQRFPCVRMEVGIKSPQRLRVGRQAPVAEDGKYMKRQW